MYERLNAKEMRRMAKKKRISEMSNDLMDLLDDIYYVAKNGLFELEMNENIKINYKDVEILRLMGYDVICAFASLKDTNVNGNKQFEYIKVAW